jgi:DNA-binding NtrC family response regulator
MAAATTILLIEPDLDAAHRVEKMLQAAGYSVVAMPDAESAISVFEYAAPHVVLVAYPTGKRASDDIAAFVRTSSRPGTPVIAMFPYPSRKLAMEALGDGCADVIPKPIDRLLLEDLLRHFTRPDLRRDGVPLTGLRLVS